MRKSLVVLALVAMVALSATSFAAVPLPVVLTNDDNPSGNSAAAYHVNTGTGALTHLTTLVTGGTGLGGGYFAATGTAIASNGSCVFVANTASDTISSFAAPSYSHTGDAGIPGMFSANGAGGSIALSPNGKAVVSGNSGLFTISLWSVGAACKLTHVADYTPSIGGDFFSPVGFSPNGKAVVVPAPDFEGAELYSVGPSGLTDVNNVNYTGIVACQNAGCFPTGLDFTNDSAVVVFGNASTGQNSVLTANIGSGGLSNPQNWALTANTSFVANPNVPWFSKNGAAGHGELYIGMSGFGSGIPSGEVTAAFTESPLSITQVGTGTAIPTPDEFLGAIRTIGATGNGSGGGLMLIAEFPNQIQAAKIGAGGSLTLGPITTDATGAGVLSISVFPNTR